MRFRADLEKNYQLGQGEYAGITAAAVFERMFEATGTTTLVELAQWLGVRQALLSDAKRSGRLPVAWIQLLVNKLPSYSQSWILTGAEDARALK